MRMILRMLLLNVCLLLFVGCHRHYVRAPDPLTREQVIEMSQQGTPPEEIIQKIDATGTVYNMGSKHVVELLENGVDENVIDH